MATLVGTTTSRGTGSIARFRMPLLPKNNKRKRGRPRIRSAPPVINTDKCKQKWKQWTDKDTEAAMKSVNDENTPILQAAKKHGVPKSTLHDRISGKVCHGNKPRPKPLLSSIEESEFANFLVEVAQAGYGKTR